jgi:O-antigen/teichoic acid export membrane protein
VAIRVKALVALKWLAASHFSLQALRFGSHLLLARLLTPEAFGLFGIVWACIATCNLLCDVGFGQSLVRSKDESTEFFNTLWTLQVIRGAIVAALIVLIATGLQIYASIETDSVDNLYSNATLPKLLFLCSLIPLINGFESLSVLLAMKQLEQRVVVKLEAVSQIFGTVVTLTAAYFGFSIWSICLGAITTAAVRLFISFQMSSLRYAFLLEPNLVREIIGFGKWVLFGSLLGVIASNGDKLIMGGLVNASVMGDLAVATLLISAFRDVYNRVVSSIYFPIVSEAIRASLESKKKVYLSARVFSDLTSTIAFCLFFFGGQLMVDLLYDDRYRNAGGLLIILSLLLLELRYALASQIWYALGSPKYVTTLIGLQSIITLIGIPIGFSLYGVRGAVYAIACSSLLTLPLTFYFKHRSGILSFRYEFFSVAASAGVILAIWFVVASISSRFL